MPTEYRSDIDALRGIAICAVLLYHVSSNVFPGGSLGVDLFFVISGYLIFGLIVTQISERSFAIRKFYLRRAFRLIPPLVLMLTATTVFAYLQFTPIALREYSQSMLGALTYSSNIYFLRETDYFGAINQQNFPLIHLWSLAVEEQFYLTIPILIVASLKGKISLKFSLTAVFALSLIGFLSLQTMGYERFAFYLAPFRAWEFCLGALAYIYRTELLFKLKQYATILQVASLVLVIASFFSFGKLGSYNFIFNFVVALGAFLAIIFGLENVILSNRWVTKSLKLVGKSSYSIYLWHFPILFAWRQIQPSPMSVLELTCYAALSIFIGIGSTVFFEAPLLRNVNSRRLLLFVICPSIVLIFVSVLMLLRDGFEQSYYTKRLSNPQQEIYSIVRPALLERERGIIDIKESRCEFTISKISELLTEYYSRHKNCLEQYGKPILISGDSHSFNLFNMIVEINENTYILGLLRGGCRLSDVSSLQVKQNCPNLNKEIASSQDIFGKILYHQSGSHLILDKNGVGDSDLAFIDSTNSSIDKNGINRTLQSLSKLSKNLETIWVGPFVEPRINLYNSQNYSRKRLTIKDTNAKLFTLLDQTIQNSFLTLENRGISLINLRYESILSALGLDAGSSIIREKCLIYRDQDHLSKCGEKLLSKSLIPWSANIIEQRSYR